ncbi:dCTP deaminase [Candidatus Micrarchaeota archaeon]|nr:dCTP deaminase [Candidatus Micrarchaeota archaeon]
MTLSNEGIKRMLARREITITPQVSEEQIGPASIDLTLSDEFWVFKQSERKREQDLKETGFEKITRKIKAKQITLAPGELVLGKTVEKIALPNNVIGRLEGRSRYARMGLAVHVTSAVVQPGSNNHQVLEIVNLAPFPIVLHAGMRVSQLLLQKMDSATSKPYAKYGKIARKQ